MMSGDIDSAAATQTLIVDLDGTLATTDTLYEAVATLFLRRPARNPGLIVALLRGPVALKHYLVEEGC